MDFKVGDYIRPKPDISFHPDSTWIVRDVIGKDSIVGVSPFELVKRGGITIATIPFWAFDNGKVFFKPDDVEKVDAAELVELKLRGVKIPVLDLEPY